MSIFINDNDNGNFHYYLADAQWRWVSPGAATDGFTYFFRKKLTTF